MQDGEHREEVVGALRLQRHDAREALRHRLDQPVLLEARQRAANRCPAQPEPAAQLVVVQPLPGGERAVDDRIAQRLVSGVTQEMAFDGPPLVGNRHLEFQ